MVWTNLDQYDSSKFSKVFYEIDENEYIDLLDSAIKQGEVICYYSFFRSCVFYLLS